MSLRKFVVEGVREEPRFYSVAAVRAANPHWFSKEAMRNFGTKIASRLYGGKYFVTSEWTGLDKGRRAYSIREAEAGEGIETIGEFLGYPTRLAAVRAIEARLRAETEE